MDKDFEAEITSELLFGVCLHLGISPEDVVAMITDDDKILERKKYILEMTKLVLEKMLKKKGKNAKV